MPAAIKRIHTMRWLFLFVLLLNLAYIAWEMSRPATDTYSNIKTTSKNVQPIVLLSELKHQRSADINQLDVTAGKQGGDLEGGSTPVVAAQNAADQIDAKYVATGRAETEQPGTGKAGSDLIQTAALPQKNLPVPIQKKNDSCYSLGPFRDLDVLRELTRELKPYVVTVDFRGSEAKEQALYWVYVKPERNREAAIETGARLKASQITDYFIIREGEKVNGISLGYFRNKNGASDLVSRVKKLGFDVVLEPVFKTHTVYWLDYQVGGDVKIPDAIFDKYIKAAKKDRIKQLSRDCAV